MTNYQATYDFKNSTHADFGATDSSFKTCKSINEIVKDIDLQTFDEFEMSILS